MVRSDTFKGLIQIKKYRYALYKMFNVNISAHNSMTMNT